MTPRPSVQRSTDQPLAGQRAVVTGSSQGIGRAIAHQLALAGAELIIHGCSHPESARQVVREIAEQGSQSHLCMGDLSQLEGQDQLIEESWQSGPVDIWINNAGADVLTGPMAKETFETKLQRLWQVDVSATIRLSRTVGQRMVKRGQGVILNMGWDQAQEGMAGDGGQMFGAIKGAIMAFSLSLAKSLAPHVRVNCLAPGWIRTTWGETAPQDWQQKARQDSLLGRWGTPEDVANMAQFLVSDAGAFINGQVISINGGATGGGREPVKSPENDFGWQVSEEGNSPQ